MGSTTRVRNVISIVSSVTACVAFSAAAHADGWSTNADQCSTVPGQLFTYSVYPSNSFYVEIYSTWSYDGVSWLHQKVAPGPLRTTQLACAGTGVVGNAQQALLVYRDSASTLKSRDLLSNWQEVAVPGGSSSYGQGLFLTDVSDGGKIKFVLFAAAAANTITMTVWDDSASPKWGTPVTLASVPGGLAITSAHRLTGYSVNVGDQGAQALVSVFVVSSDGHLRENKGILGGTRSWIDHGLAPGGKAFSPTLGYGPTATGLYNSITGHPGSYSESEYMRRIFLPTADQTAIFERVSDLSTNTFNWVQIASSSTYPPVGFSLASGAARGCFQPGEPCVSATRVTERFGTPTQFASFYTGATDGRPPGPGWTVLPQTTNAQPQPGYFWAPWTNSPNYSYGQGVLIYIDSATNMVAVNIDTGAATSLGPP